MKVLTDRQKKFFGFIKEWSLVKFTGGPRNYDDVCNYITRCKESAYVNYYLSNGGDSAYL